MAILSRGRPLTPCLPDAVAPGAWTDSAFPCCWPLLIWRSISASVKAEVEARNPQATPALPSVAPSCPIFRSFQACSAHLYPEGTTIRAEIDNGEFPDTALLGRTLFDKYNRTLIIAGLALLVSSIGVVVLSRRPSGK